MFKIGDFSKLSKISIRMLRYYNDLGYTMSGPMFNIYHVSPGMDPNPENWVTEICYPIEKQ